MKLSSLFKNSSSTTNTSSTWPWPLPTCGYKPKTLSFRLEKNNIFNSTFHLDDDNNDTTSYSLDEFFSELDETSFSTSTTTINGQDCIEKVIKGLRLENERLFFEPEETSSILDFQESKNDDDDVNVVVGQSLGLASISYPQIWASGQSLELDNDNDNDNDDDDEGSNINISFVPIFNNKESAIVMGLDSKDPFVDFRESMEEMVNAHEINQDWESLEELLTCYLKVNPKSNHGYIVGAFVDLLVNLDTLSGHQHDNNNNNTYINNNVVGHVGSSHDSTIVEEQCLLSSSSTTTTHSFTSPLSFCSSSSSTSTSSSITSTSACLSLLEQEEEEEEEVIQRKK